MRKVFGFLLVGIVLCSSLGYAQEEVTINKVVQEVLFKFYQEEMGNKVTLFNYTGLASIMEQNLKAFDKKKKEETEKTVTQ